VLRGLRAVFIILLDVGDYVLECRSVNLSRRVVVQANLQAFVLQQYLTDIRYLQGYGVFICLSSVLPTNLAIIISGFCTLEDWIETVLRQTRRREALISMVAGTSCGAAFRDNCIILCAFYSGALFSFIKKKLVSP
jgi:hypothetical protein